MFAGRTALFIVALLCPLVFSLPQFGIYTLTLAVPNQLSVFGGDSNGKVTFASQINTGGNGITADQPGIGSQGAVVVYGNYIFAVNPGSDSVSLFSIDPTNPTNVNLIGTASSGGDWPVSVTANADWACVVNAGTNNLIRCFTYNSAGLTVVPNTDRPLNITLTLPPIIHTGPAQISFLPDGSGLAISNKGANPPVLLFSIANKQISATPVASPIMGMVPFGFDFDTDGTMVLSDAAPTGTLSGIELLSLNSGASPSASFLLPQYFLIPNQGAACWVVRSPVPGHFFVANTVTMNITEIARSGDTLTVVANYPTGQNTTPVDLIVAHVAGNDYLFVQSKGTEVIVFSLAGAGKASLIQVVNLQPTGPQGAGVAAYVVTQSTPPKTSPASTVACNSLLGLLVMLCVMLI